MKFRTHLGPPIYYEEGVTPKELQEKTAAAIEKLIVENQRIPGRSFIMITSNTRLDVLEQIILKMLHVILILFIRFDSRRNARSIFREETN